MRRAHRWGINPDLPDNCPECSAPKENLVACAYRTRTVDRTTREVILPGFAADSAYRCESCGYKEHSLWGMNLFSIGVGQYWFTDEQLRKAIYHGEKEEIWEDINDENNK